jgi:preprotein translocase subunit YajC
MEILLLAQAPAQGGNPILSFMPMIILFVIFWVIVMVPQRRQAKAHQEMVASLQRGDQVVTAGGLIGEITAVKDDQVQLKSGQSTVVVERSKVARRVGPVPAGAEKK